MHRRPRTSRHLWRLLSLAAFILLATSITQCRMVTDRLVRVEAQDLSAGSCIKACARAAKEAIEDENELHKDRLEACGDGDEDDGSDDIRGAGTFRRDKPDDKGKPDKRDKKNKHDACVAAEAARHKAALKAIEDRRQDCMNGCHHQGGGTGR